MAISELDQIDEVLSGDREDEHCHLARPGERGRALCGSTVSRHPEGSLGYTDPPDRCPACGRPICPTCRAIWRTYRRSGAWEGPSSA